MGDIEFMKIVKARVLEDFERECLEIVEDQQFKGRVVHVQYNPITLNKVVGAVQKSDLMHSAMIIARRTK